MGRVKFLEKSKVFFGRAVSLDSRVRSYVFLFVLFVLALIPVRVLESGPNLSICSRIFGEYCYSVGITRGVSALLKGNLSLALEYNPLAVLVLGVMVGIVTFDLVRRFLR